MRVACLLATDRQSEWPPVGPAQWRYNRSFLLLRNIIRARTKGQWVYYYRVGEGEDCAFKACAPAELLLELLPMNELYPALQS